MAERPETGGSQATEPRGVEDKPRDKPSAAELKKTLADHDRWIASDGKEGQCASLLEADLTGAEMAGANLVKARFAAAVLRKANLQGAICREAYFHQALLERASLRKADLQKANLSEANLAGADLDGADFTEAVLKKAQFPNASLQGANLNGCRLENLDLLRADLRGARLFRANLRDSYLLAAKLRGADLHGAQLEGARLENADFTDANLQYTNFDQVLDTDGNVLFPPADVKGASFRNADLSDASLADVSGLQARQLAGSNLSSARLPDDIKQFEALDHVAEISKHARNIFLGVVGACVYSWLSIATTTDAALITGSTATPLPIIQTPVSIAGFYWAAPPILFVLYVYLHLYLQRMWEGMAELPAVFPDGRTLDRRVYPWLLSGLVAANVTLLRERRPPASWLQVGLSVIAAWGLVPFTLFLFWGRYLTRHDWPWTIWHVVLFLAAAAFGFASYRLAKTTLRGEDVASQGIIGRAERPRLRHLFQGLRNVEHRWVLATAIITSVLSLGAIEGTPGGEPRSWRSWIPSPTSLFNVRTVAELTELDISVKPANWTGGDPSLIKGAQLRGVDLRRARAQRVFLVRADLRDSDLRGADFSFGLLQDARLRDADLRGASLRGVDLYGADLLGADLGGVDLRGANLRGAKHLDKARFAGACVDKTSKLPAGLKIATCDPANR